MRYLGCNRAFEQFVGMKTDQLMGRTAHDIWPKDQADDFHHTDQEVLASLDRQTLVFEETVQDSEGASYDFLIHKATFQDQDGTSCRHHRRNGGHHGA